MEVQTFLKRSGIVQPALVHVNSLQNLARTVVLPHCNFLLQSRNPSPYGGSKHSPSVPEPECGMKHIGHSAPFVVSRATACSIAGDNFTETLACSSVFAI